jgi:hypothetical protein
MASFERYGRLWPEGVSNITIELMCYRLDWPVDRGGLGAYRHLVNAIQMLWPERLPNGQDGHIFSPWTYRRIWDWCTDRFYKDDRLSVTWWGPAASGKTTDAAAIILADWFADPLNTTSTLCSTTRDMLATRIWGEIIRMWTMGPLIHGHKFPGELQKSKMKLVVVGEDGVENTKAAIRGIAVQQGTAEEAKNNIIGVHNKYNRLVIDEMQDGHMDTAVEAETNLMTAGFEYRFLGMGNPESKLDPLGRASEPIGGWENVDRSMDAWPTKRGKTLYFNGMKSPALTNPKKYFFLMGQKDIDNTMRVYGAESRQMYSMRYGWIPPDGLVETVLSESMMVEYGMGKEAIWRDGYAMCAGIDPAYASGGDKCVVYPLKYGYMTNGIFGLEYQTPIEIKTAASGTETKTTQIARQIIDIVVPYGMKAYNLAMDTTSVQGMLADRVEELMEDRGILRVDSASKPSDSQVSQEDDRPGHEAYRNRASEILFNITEFARYRQIRGLNDVETCQQLTERRVMDKNLKTRWVEPKPEYKARNRGVSPDKGDAAGLAATWVKERGGMFPGKGFLLPEQADVELDAEDLIDDPDTMYLTDDIAV